MSTVTLEVDFVVRQCSECGITYCLPSNFSRARCDDHNSWYCPNGHSQYVPAKSDAEKLRERLAEEQKKLANAQFELIAEKQRAETAEKSKKKLQQRIKNGACPCCHRQFTQLTRHMKTKHPEFVKAK